IAALAGFALAAPADTAFANPPAHAKGKGHGKGRPGGPPPGHRGRGDGGVEFSFHFGERSRDLIVGYYDRHPRARRGYRPLPPGIRKNLRRGKPLPPGIAKQYLPERLEERLPPLPGGYARFVVGDTLVIVDDHGIVVDLFVEF
ncbi:MAG: hypothetical protein ACLFWF_04910, partial [Alphaproteobacteria bacterium]